MAGIIEVLTKIGEDNLKVQRLGQCAKKVVWRRGVTEISMLTEELGPTDFPDVRDALVVWCDKETLKQVMDEILRKEAENEQN